ncbi:VanW family protein [Aristaeella hokkaidonensis]|uniref:VanW family protein n=1 Tax=Aristaeella hokkaidonensis TaxID=3046382 RepID=A0AC61MYG7_9FIRM|nr:VanW family protein [Aristaeella hokkaidonensis]QUC66913.1 VanW family protein [Aristaeella hokkaidonensis]SNT94456.1 Vancomycin resistance protein YoaR, contains peptidoglycan-binding and VanW domains [Aristaeella hokkaidonensis]
MAKLKRYDLYEGDDDIISDPLPGKKPLGRDEGLKARDEYDRRVEEEARKRRYFASNEEDDGLGAPSTLFDDFDRFEAHTPVRNSRPKYKRKEKHRGAWAAVIFFCLLLLAGMAIAVVPQLTGVRYKFLPNLAFVNGNLIIQDGGREDFFDECRKEVYSGKIYPGIYIDDEHVGGLTKEEAIRKISSLHNDAAGAFDITVSVGNESWHVNSERVPVSRNTEEVVEKAWATGRGNTSGLKDGAVTPFQEHVNQVSGLRTYPATFATKQDYDHEALRNLTDGIVNYVNREPVNSMVYSFDFNSKTFTFTDDQPGAKIDPDQLYAQLTEVLDSGTTKQELRVVPEKVIADLTKAELMNSFGLISAYTTNTTKDKNRNANIELSAQAISGITVQPGETFSFNGATGERTAAKGYKEAPAISGGQSKDEVGGGVCQTSSTLFNAVVRADLEIVERNAHAWPSSYIEKGFDATVNWPGLDFKFKNNTDQPIFIVAGYSNRQVTVNIYGMSLGPGVKIDLESELVRTIPQPEGINYVLNTSLAPGETKKTVTGRKGYEVNTWKVWYQGNREIKREVLFKTTYKAYQETMEYNPQ